jgi:predicted permease
MARTPWWRRSARRADLDPKADVDDELRFHLESRVDELIGQGWDPDKARHEAQRRFGDVLAVRRAGERLRPAPRVPTHDRASARSRWSTVATGLGTELGQTVRHLARRPARTALVVVTLAAGIAAVSTIYAVVDAIELRPLPYPDAARMVTVGRVFPDRPWREDAPSLQRLAGTSIATFLDWKARARTLDHFVAAEQRSALLPDTGRGPELTGLVAVTEGFLELFGVEPVLGRGFRPDDFAPDAPPVVVLSHKSWLARYGGDPGIVGRTANQATVVGILPPGFDGPSAYFTGRAEFWTPLKVGDARYRERGRRSVVVFARLAPDATLEMARAEIASIQRRLADEYPADNILPDGALFGAGANLLHAETVGSTARPLALFLGAAALLLLIAGMNSTNLLYLRALEREHEIALRRALGASQSRVVAGLLLESLVLAAIAGAVGLLLTFGGVAAFTALGPGRLLRMGEVAVNTRVLSLSAAVSLGAGLLAGLVPALALARGAHLGTGLRQAGAPTIAGGGQRLRDALVVAQIAAALVVVVGASLLFHSLLRVRSSDLGFEPENLYAVSVPLKVPGMDGVPSRALWDRLIGELAKVPGVEAIAAGSDAPFSDPSWAPLITLPGDAAGTRRAGVSAFVVSPRFFDTIGARITRGTGFAASPPAGGEHVAVVNEAFVAAYLRDREPVGAVVIRGPDEGEESPVRLRVVGVVQTIVQRRVEDGPRAAVYVPHTQQAWPYGVTVMVRSTRRGEAFGDELRQAAARFSAGVPVTRLAYMPDFIDGTLVEPRFRAVLFATFAAVSGLLALVGLYGVLSHTVGRRTRELGVRMALGATRRTIFASVLRQGLLTVAAGLLVGLVGAAGLSQSLRTLLYGVDALDPATFALAGLALASVALVAVAAPARRATHVDIATTLRE